MSTFAPMHFADWIARHAVTRPNVAAVVGPNTRLTYGEFHRAINVAARKLADMGVKRGETVALCIQTSPLQCVLIAALNRMGVVSMSITPAGKTPIKLPEAAAPAKTVVEEPVQGVAPEGALKVHASWLREDGGAPWDGEGFSDENDIVRIFLTSGTTGKVKAVGLSMRQIEARIFKYSIGQMADAGARAVLSQIGVRSSAGFRSVFATIWAGGTVYLGWPESAVPAAIARHAIEKIDASPVQYQEIVRQVARGNLDLSSLRAAWVTGSGTPKALIAAIRTRLCSRLVNIYGSTEMGMMAFGTLGPQRAGIAGVLAPWVSGEAVDAEDNPLPPGAEGTLRFKSAEMANGYLGDPDATEQHFRDGWFYPGDTGTISADGVVALMGRSLDQINAGGVKVAPDLVEEAVLAFAGIEQCAAFGAPDAMGVERIWTAIVAENTVDLEKLGAQLRDKLSSRAPYRIFRLDEIPRNENGKVLRSELRKLAAEHLGATASG